MKKTTEIQKNNEKGSTTPMGKGSSRRGWTVWQKEPAIVILVQRAIGQQRSQQQIPYQRQDKRINVASFYVF